MENIIISFEDGSKREYPKGVKLGDILNSLNDYKYDVVSAKFMNQLINYEDSIMKSGNLTLFDLNTSQGNKIYERGLTILFITCAMRVLGKNTNIRIRHPLDKGIFCEIDKKISSSEVNEIKSLMRKKVSQGIIFEPIETSRMEAIQYFKNIEREDKVKTLTYTTSNFVKLFKFDGIYHYVIGDLPHDSSVFKYFDLTLLEGKGIVIRFPFAYDNGRLSKYVHHENYVNSLEEYSRWGKLLHINSIGELNEQVIGQGAGEIINLSETIQDYKLLSIAEEISLNKDNLKLVLISGPSSSGKTTTSKKLSLYLKSLGLNPYHLSLDDYFLERDKTPLDENGKPDYEGIRAIDIKLFNNQMEKLLKGNLVVTPTYDFIQGRKVFNRKIQMQENDILIVEGLHALNEEISKDVPKDRKYKIYISPLIFMNIDNDNRISLTDIRLLRRMVRDYRTRGYSPSKTLATWDDVRRGEEKYVFPYQDDANVIFNSFLAYELGVLKTYVEPLLYSVSADDPEYHTAIRLLELLKLVLPIPSSDVPKLSILREFIGESYFER